MLLERRPIASEKLTQGVSFASPQFFDSLGGFLGNAMRFAVSDEPIQRVGKRKVMRFLPELPETEFRRPFASQLPGGKANEHDRLSVAPDDDSRFVLGINDNH